MATPNLDITELSASQADKTTRVNQMVRDLEGALTEDITLTLTGATHTVTSAEAGLNMIFAFDGTPGANCSITVPDARKKLYIARDETTDGYTHTFKTVTGTGIVLDKEWKLLYSDGTDMTIVSDLGYRFSQNHGDGQGSIFVNSELLLHHVFEVPVDFAADMPGCQAVLNAASAGNMDCTVHKNGAASHGTIRFATGTVGAFGTPTTITATSFAVGDILTILGPGSADGSAADITFTIRGRYA